LPRFRGDVFLRDERDCLVTLASPRKNGRSYEQSGEEGEAGKPATDGASAHGQFLGLDERKWLRA
jgi:hypothetical protein